MEGDFVVHLQHGIALYRGLTKLDTAQGAREVISIEFDDQVTLHVPLQESHLISRYVGLSKSRPQLGRIGSGRWERRGRPPSMRRSTSQPSCCGFTRRARRRPGTRFPTTTRGRRNSRPRSRSTERPRKIRLRAIAETKTDMERTRPMDRLICGDVGYGKTELAMRGAFKADAKGGRQVAVLVPTTVLAQQHLNTFRERMAGYPIAIEMISRFRSRAEQKKILAATTANQVDILIGTHRLLQRDVQFKDLGPRGHRRGATIRGQA